MNQAKLRWVIRKLVMEAAAEAEPVPGDAPPEKQVHVFDFDDTLGLTTNSNGIMLYKDGVPAHKSEKEVKDWMKSLGLSDRDLLPPRIASIPERDNGYAVYLTSSGLANVQKNFSKDKQAVTGKSEPPSEGESILIDFTPSSFTDVKTTQPIDSTIDKLKAANSQGSKTIVITARTAAGKGKDFHGKTVDATNAKDMEQFLSDQGAPTTDGVMGVTGQDKGKEIIKKYVKPGQEPEEIHFYDDLKKNTDEVEAAVAEKVPSELFVYGPGEFAHNQADPNKPNKSFKKGEEKKTAQTSGYKPEGQRIIERWQRLAGLIK